MPPLPPPSNYLPQPPGSNGNGAPHVPPPPPQPPGFPPQTSRRYLAAEYVSGGTGIYAAAYYRSLPPYIDDLTKSFGADLYDRMLLDDQVNGCLRTVIEAVLSEDVILRPAVDDKDQPYYALSKRVLEYHERTLDRLPRSLEEWSREMLLAMAVGHKVAEKVWRPEESGPDAGRLVLDRLKVKGRNRTAFVVDVYSNLVGLLGLLPGQAGYFPIQSVVDDLSHVPNILPLEKFALLTWDPIAEDPRGQSLLRCVYEAWWEKLQACRDWLRHLAQFGSPSLLGITAPDAQSIPLADSYGNPIPTTSAQPTPEQLFVNELLRFRNGYAMAVPHGADVKILTAAAAGGDFLRKVEHCERRIAAAINLTARTRMESKRNSKADAEQAQDVSGLAIKRAKNWVAWMITQQILYPGTRYNFGEQAARVACPKATLQGVEHQDWSQNANAVAPLVSTGFLQKSQWPAMYEKLGLPPAEAPPEEDQQGAVAPPAADDEEEQPQGQAQGQEQAAGFAGLPGPYEEGKHPRGYHGRYADKPGDATLPQTAKQADAEILGHVAARPAGSVFNDPVRLQAEEAVAAALAQKAGKGGRRKVPVTRTFAPALGRTVFWLGDEAHEAYVDAEGRLLALHGTDPPRTAYVAPDSPPGEIEYAARKALALKVPAALEAAHGARLRARAAHERAKGLLEFAWDYTEEVTGQLPANVLAPLERLAAKAVHPNTSPHEQRALAGGVRRWLEALAAGAPPEDWTEKEFRGFRPDLRRAARKWAKAEAELRKVSSAAFAGLPGPYEEGKHPRSYHGRYAEKPDATAAVNKRRLPPLTAAQEMQLRGLRAALSAEQPGTRDLTLGLRAAEELAFAAPHDGAVRSNLQALAEELALPAPPSGNKADYRGWLSDRLAERFPWGAKEAVADYPSLAAFGAALQVDGYHQPLVQDHVADLALVPETLARQAAAAGVTVHIGYRFLASLDDNAPDLQAPPRGWPPGQGWERVGGVYNRRTRTAAAGRPGGGSETAGIALHEFGHALGHVLKLDDDPELVALHRELYGRLNPYLQQDGPGSTAGRQELLAEGFAHTVKDRGGAVAAYGPKFVGWLEGKLGLGGTAG